MTSRWPLRVLLSAWCQLRGYHRVPSWDPMPHPWVLLFPKEGAKVYGTCATCDEELSALPAGTPLPPPEFKALREFVKAQRAQERFPT